MPMPDGELPFSHEYAKHNRAVFPTIRRRDKFGDVGDVVTVTGDNEKLGDAEVVAKETVQFRDLPTWLLCYDCDVARATTDSGADLREAAYDHINNFYRNSIEMDEPLTMYWLRWVDKSDQQELVTDDWDPEPADLREGETPDDRSHAARNAEQLEMADDTGGDESDG